MGDKVFYVPTCRPYVILTISLCQPGGGYSSQIYASQDSQDYAYEKWKH